VYLKQEDFNSLGFGTKRFILQPANIHWHTFSEQTKFYHMLQNDRLDLMHFTYFSYPILYHRPFVSTIHDLTPLIYKTGKASKQSPIMYEAKHLGLRLVLSEIMRRSKAVITPSNAVKNEIIERFGARYGSKVYAIAEGLDESIKDTKENNKLSKEFGYDFFFYAGNFYPHKNVEKLIDAYSMVATKMPLVLAGPDDFFAERIKRYVVEHNLQKKVILYKKPTREDLVFFYKSAKALIHPSIAEGFGLTLLEAAYFNCPVIASDIPVIRELLDSNYVAFDPNTVSDIAEKIQYFIDKRPKFTYQHIVKKYSFDRMAKQTVEVYKTVLSA
jgi:glycosyltransferase involved in cell wall biosynthesis